MNKKGRREYCDTVKGKLIGVLPQESEEGIKKLEPFLQVFNILSKTCTKPPTTSDKASKPSFW